MAGIAFSFARRVGHPVCDNSASLLRRLSHRGAGQLIRRGSFAAGVCESCAVKPDPSSDTDLVVSDELVVAVDGRIDNRVELLARVSPRLDACSSNARLVATLFQSRGLQGLGQIRGPFVAVVHDVRLGQTHLLRDPVGGRRLAYVLSATGLDVCTEIDPLLSLCNTRALDEISVVNALSGCQRPSVVPLFKSIQEVEPGSVLTVTRTSTTTHNEGVLKEITPQGTSEAQWQDEFMHCLEQSVACRVSDQSNVNIMMSGGVDSTLVAAVSAGTHRPVNTWSWRFNRFADCDEKDHIRAMGSRYGFNQHWVDADDYWPLRRPQRLLHQDGARMLNPFRDAKQKLYEQVANGGQSVLLTGCFGDHLYASSGYWLRDLLRQGQWVEAARCLSRHMTGHGLRAVIPGQVARSTLGISHIKLRPVKSVPWLRSGARRLLRDNQELLDHRHYRHQHLSLISGNRSASSHSGEFINAQRAGVELRHPYRDWRLIQHVLSLPESALFRPGQRKRIAKCAARELLPECVVDDSNHANLLSFYQFGKYHSAGRWRREADRLVQHYFGQWLSPDWPRHLAMARHGNHKEMLQWAIRSTAMSVHAKQQHFESLPETRVYTVSRSGVRQAA